MERTQSIIFSVMAAALVVAVYGLGVLTGFVIS